MAEKRSPPGRPRASRRSASAIRLDGSNGGFFELEGLPPGSVTGSESGRLGYVLDLLGADQARLEHPLDGDQDKLESGLANRQEHPGHDPVTAFPPPQQAARRAVHASRD